MCVQQENVLVLKRQVTLLKINVNLSNVPCYTALLILFQINLN